MAVTHALCGPSLGSGGHLGPRGTDTGCGAGRGEPAWLWGKVGRETERWAETGETHSERHVQRDMEKDAETWEEIETGWEIGDPEMQRHTGMSVDREEQVDRHRERETAMGTG